VNRRLFFTCRVVLAVVTIAGYSQFAPAVFAAEEVGETGNDHAESGDGHDEAHQGGHAEHIGEKGVNKDPSAISGDLVIWTMVVFVTLLVALRKFAWTPIITALDKREESIRQDIASAEDARVNAEKMLAEHEQKLAAVQDEVREIIAEAKRDAEGAKQDIMAQAQSEAENTKRRAVEDIEHARDVALRELFDSMAGQVAGATEYVLGRSLSGEDQDRLIDEALSQFAGRA